MASGPTSFIIAATRFEAQTLTDQLRAINVGVLRSTIDTAHALDDITLVPADLIFVARECKPMSGTEWVRLFRRAIDCSARKAAVFMIAPRLTASVAELCRNAGANAIIGKPASAATIRNTISKVLAKPRPFIETSVYVGPCRRAGIITSRSAKRRRNDAQAA